MSERFAASAGEPRTRDEILAAFASVQAGAAELFATLDTAAFLAPLGERWSPAENLQHVTLTDRALTRGFGAPPELLEQRFGRPGRPSRSFAEIRRTYQALGAALVAPAAFQPERATPANPESWRAEVTRLAETAADEWTASVRGWGDAALDTAQMPHPLLGALTLREFAGWNLYHHVHHWSAVARRLAVPSG